MGLESLLARLEYLISATPKEEVQPLEHLEHQGTREVFQEKPLQNKPGTPDTPRTSKIQQGWPDISKPDLAAEHDTRHLLPPAALSEIPADEEGWPRIKVTIVGKNAVCVNILTQSAWTIADWGTFARRHYDVFTTVIGAPTPDVAREAAEKARRGLSRQSEGREDLASGGATMTDAANLTDLAVETEDLREHFEERSAILEHDAGLPRAEAEAEAARITATLARNRGYLWVSLRAALADYPVLLAQVPDRPGPVDALPWVYPRSPCSGTSGWCGRERSPARRK
jgi:hypothetical protein